MGGAEVASIGFALVGEILGQLQKNGIVGSPDWIKYAQAGLFVAKRAADLVAKFQSNPGAYDNLTPELVRAQLLPTDWEELEQRAAQRFAVEQIRPS